MKTTVALGRLPKETIRLGGRSQRKQRQKQKKNLGAVNNHSPLQEVKSEDEDEVENQELRGVIQDHSAQKTPEED